MNSVKGFFSQTDNISKIIVDEILAAKQSVLLAMYTLTLGVRSFWKPNIGIPIHNNWNDKVELYAINIFCYN